MATAPGYPPAPPQPTSSGGCSKVSMVLGCGCLVMVLICAGIFGAGAWAVNDLAKSFQQDPVVASKMGKEIADWPFAEQFEPKGSIDAKVFWQPLARGVFYEGEDGQVLILGEITMPGIPTEEFIKGMREGGTKPQQGENQGRLVESKTKDLVIRGKPATFTFAKMEYEQEGMKVEMWQVSGGFESKNGPAFIFYQGPYDEYTEDELIAEIQAIK